VIDDIGMLPISLDAAEALFRVGDAAYADASARKAVMRAA